MRAALEILGFVVISIWFGLTGLAAWVYLFGGDE